MRARLNDRLAGGAGVAAVLVLLGPGAAAQRPFSTGLEELLREHLRLSDAERQDLADGRAVARALDTFSASESAAAGAVIVNVPPERLVAEFQRIETERRGPGVQAIGSFAEPPSPADLGRFTLTADEVASLRRCRLGDCELKLPADAIRLFQRAVDWGASNATQHASALMRGWLFEHLSAYRREGNSALGYYHDKQPPIDLAGELAVLLEHDDAVGRFAPEVLSYLASYPQFRRTSVHDTFYWARVQFGLKPTIRLNHVSIHPTPGAPAGLSHVIATKQLYASHYLRAALEFRLVFPLSDDGFLLVVVTRSNNDGMTGLFGWVVRSSVRRRSRDGLARYLENVKTSLESGRHGEIVGAP